MKENLFYISSGENFSTHAASYFTFLEGQTASAAPICYWVKNITQTIRQIFELSLGIFQVCKTLASKKKNSTIGEDLARTQETIFNPWKILRLKRTGYID